MLAGDPVLAAGALINPAIQSVLSVAAGPQRQGEAQGGLSSLQGLSMVVGPLSTGLAFARRRGPAARCTGPARRSRWQRWYAWPALAAVLSLPWDGSGARRRGRVDRRGRISRVLPRRWQRR